jgi:hypothetical protein
MPDHSELLGGVRHIVHDYATLVSTGTGILKGVPAPWNGPVEQSFIVQCRKFAHFFQNRERRHPDIFAKHYVGSSITFDLPTWDGWYDHMDKHLFHLSYARVSNIREWTGRPENGLFLDEFRGAWKKFLSALVSTEWSEHFEREIAAKNQRDFPVLDLR